MTVPIIIDGRAYQAAAGQSLLQAILAAGVDLPHLCYDTKLSPGGNCGLCLVSVNGGEPVKACETQAAPGMEIVTHSEALSQARQAALSKLLAAHRGDCIAPCKKACPAHSDCQGYAGLIAEGYFSEAARLLKSSYPIPASLGRVCPHPCEEACRRATKDAPLSLAALKRFAADSDLASGQPWLPETAAASGKKVAVIGGGPAGLTAAWLLTIAGHAVTVYEAMPQAGGMLRYGIPEFRLPKAVLDQEIAAIAALGVKFVYNYKVCDQCLETLRRENDAVFMAIGAWKNTPLGLPGEDLPQVMSGLELLRRTAMGETPQLGREVAVIGGGNTAMDAVRTAVRLPGVERVTLLYRRSREQMPAFAEEVAEAEKEGVSFRFLVSPEAVEATGQGLRVKLQGMRLGAADSNGRLRPLPIPGEISWLECDSLIAAIGQQVEDGIPGSPQLSTRQAIQVNAAQFTSLPGVFAGGDGVNDGPGLAVEAVADGQRAAAAIDAYLRGESYDPALPAYAEQTDFSAADLPPVETAPRQTAAELPLTERQHNFRETCATLTPEQAQAEAARCLECGCQDVYECQLLSYAHELGLPFVNSENTAHQDTDRKNPYIFYDANKCLGCGKCVRVCKEVMGYGCYELDEQPQRTQIKPSANYAYCSGCGQCAEHCPSGALTERNPRMKAVPLPPEKQRNVCNYCGVGCSTVIEHYGEKPLKVTPAYGGSLEANVLCRHGRFGWHTAMGQRDLTTPLHRIDGQLQPVDWQSAYAEILTRAKAIQSKYGPDALGLIVADRMTCEEIYLSRQLAAALGTTSVYSANIYDGGLEDVLGADGSSNSYQELSGTDCVFIFGADVPSYYAMLALPVQQALFGHGAKLLLAATEGWNGFGALATRQATIEDDSRFLKEMLKACLDLGRRPQQASGLTELAESLKDVVPGPESLAFAKDYSEAKTAMIMLDRERVSHETACLLADLAVVCGHIGKPHTGLIQMLQHNNTQTVSFVNIRRKMPHLAADIEAGRIKGLLLMEQFIDEKLAEKLEFAALLDSASGPAFAYSDVFLPMPGYGAYNGHYCSAEGRVQQVHQVYQPAAGVDGWQVLSRLLAAAGGPRLDTLAAVDRALAADYPIFRPCLEGKAEFVLNGPVRYAEGFAHQDGLAHLQPAAAQARALGEMCFADVPLCTWFGQLVAEGLLQY